MSDFRHPPRCCPDGRPSDGKSPAWTRRRFIQTVGSSALGGIALGGLSWPALAEKTAPGMVDIQRRPLRVQPVLVYSTPERHPQTSWRSWGGIQTRAQADEEAPLLPICRSQIDVRFSVDSRILAERMPGFHWMTGYGDYLREIGYALKKSGISWEVHAG